MVRLSRFQFTIGTVGALVAFMASNYWAYQAGSSADDSLLIDTMSKYRLFYEEVRDKHQIACDDEGNLRGLYLSQYRSMLPVVDEQVKAPYDNPCPTIVSEPTAPKNLAIHYGNSWSTWQEFLEDDDPSMVFRFGDRSVAYPIDKAWRESIIEWHDQSKELSAECEKGKDCSFRLSTSEKAEKERNK